MKRTPLLLRYPFLLLTLFLLAAYLPVFLPFFHIKNDTITQNLPVRTFVSESLYSGYFPWWNPYINFGIPQYGDMNTGFWNPFCWLIAGTSGYGVWAITLEEMFYILIGGWGIYLLCRDHLRCPGAAFIAAMTYMTSGFIMGHLQHFCWVAGTAFFPYVLLFFLRVQHSPTVRNFILGGWCIFFFVASTHPGLIIGALYFLLLLLIALFCLHRDIRPAIDTRTLWISGAILLLSGLLLSIIVIVSDVDVLRNISRGSIVTLRQSLRDPTTFQSYLSLLFPLSVQKNETLFRTDITMRNAYVGLLIFACLAVTGRRRSKKFLLSFGAILLFFVLLSSGGLFKIFAYHFIPLTGYVRLNGEFNYFVVLILLLAGAAGLAQGMDDPASKEKIRRVFHSLQWLFGIALAVSVIVIFLTRKSLLFVSSPAAGNLKQSIKWVVEQLSFWDMIMIQSVIQLVMLYLVRRYWNRNLMLIVGAHQMLICWCILPYTGLGMADKASRQALISKAPKGIHAPEQKALASTAYLDSIHTPELGLIGAYSKKIGYVKQEAYPIVLTNSISFFHDTALLHFILAQSWLFLSKDTASGTATCFDSTQIHIVKFGPGMVQAVIDNTNFHYLTFLQNDYPYWKASVNGRPVAHFTGFKTFVTMALPPGRQNIEISFDPAPIRKTLRIQLLIALSTLLLLCSRQIRNKRLIRPRPIA